MRIAATILRRTERRAAPPQFIEAIGQLRMHPLAWLVQFETQHTRETFEVLVSDHRDAAFTDQLNQLRGSSSAPARWTTQC